jgi:CHASE2 domain-containing sensor protein
LGAFEPLDLKLLDWRYRLRGVRAASDEIALIEIDDATIEAYGNWPLPRDQYALLITALGKAQASVVGLDLLFLGSDRFDPRFDALLALVTAGHDNVVHSIAFPPEHTSPEARLADVPDNLDLLEKHGIRGADIPAFNATAITLPFGDLVRSSKTLAHIIVVVDRDGIIRRVPTFFRYRDALYPYFGLSVAALSTGSVDGTRVEAVPGGLRVHWPAGREALVPTDSDGTATIDFAGDRDAFAHIYSMLEVLQWYAAGDSARLSEVFKNRITLVGVTAVGQVAADIGATPFSTAAPLLLVHANAVNAFLTGRFLARPRPVVYVAALFGLSILLGWLLTAGRVHLAVLAIGICLAGVLGIAYLLFLRGTDMPPTAGLALPPLIYAVTQTYKYVFLERKARAQQRELQIAKDIQRRLLPLAAPQVQEFDVFGINIPAHEVGGDYYDWIVLKDGSLAVTVGDVCGKGIPAAILMAHLRASFHAEAKEDTPPRDILRAMNRSLHRSVEPGLFATFILAIASPRDERFILCNGGHNPALIVHDGQVEKSSGRGLALGILEDVDYEEEPHPWSLGDVLILYSDGITECTRGDEMYGEARLCDLVAGLDVKSLSAFDIGQAILDDVKSFSHGHLESDDTTLVLVKRVGYNRGQRKVDMQRV